MGIVKVNEKTLAESAITMKLPNGVEKFEIKE